MDTRKPLKLNIATITFFLACTMINLHALADMPASASCPDLLNHRLTSLQGNPVNLCDYRGRVVLFVNTASYCANTPQYAKLEKLQEQLQAKGLTVIGFPANDFGEQEPGSNAEIAQFCKLTYNVKFPMMEKSGVKRENANPVFSQLIAMSGQAPEWNFHKYLVGRDGRTVMSFPAFMQPDDPGFTQAIDTMLSESPTD